MGLLAALSWIVKLDTPLFHIGGKGFSGKAIILFVGGLFLLYKATKEIHHKLEAEEEVGVGKAAATFAGVIFQIMLLDMVFSIDSVITAVGMASELWIMIAANVIALGVMLFAAKGIAGFVERHPTVKILALSFLLMIGLLLVAEGFEIHVPKGYVYFAMAYSVAVEMINIRASSNKKAAKAAAAAARAEADANVAAPH